jgi:hypothetical protein
MNTKAILVMPESGKCFSHVLILMACLLFGGCATDTMTKADLLQAFEVCGIRQEYRLSSTATCLQVIGSGFQSCDINDLDPVTRATLLQSGKAARTHLGYGTVLPIKTKDDEEAAVGIDHNTNIILYSHGDHDRLYLAGSTWMSGDFIVGLKSRLPARVKLVVA